MKIWNISAENESAPWSGPMRIRWFHARLFLGLIIAAALSLTGCGSPARDAANAGLVDAANAGLADAAKNPEPAELSFSDGTLTYTNLVSEQMQDEVRKIMLAGGVPPADTDKFFVWVNDFNQVMGDCASYELQDAFITVNAKVVDYGDYYPMSVTWYKTNQRRYSDILCRIAAFQLAKHGISVAEPLEPSEWECYDDTQWLYSDWDAISGFPLVDFSEEEIHRYFTIFNPIEAPENGSEEEMFQAVRKAWEGRTVRFADSEVSLITIWTQYEKQIAASHAAVLVHEGDTLWLIEKTNPQSPYQAAKFSSVDQVREYMYESIHADDVRYGMETGTCLVLQNDQRLS